MRAFLFPGRTATVIIVVSALFCAPKAHAAGVRDCSTIPVNSIQDMAARLSCGEQNQLTLAHQVADLRADRDALASQVIDLRAALETETVARSTADSSHTYTLGLLEWRIGEFDFVAVNNELAWHDTWLHAMGEQFSCMTGDSSVQDALFAGQTQCPRYSNATMGTWLEGLDGTTQRQGQALVSVTNDIDDLWATCAP